MRLTASESQAIAQLRKRYRQWFWTRWLMVIGGAACAIASVLGLFGSIRTLSEVSSGAKDSPTVALLLASANTETIIEFKFLAIVGLFLLVWAIARWRGDPVITLLLGIADRETEASGEAPPNSP